MKNTLNICFVLLILSGISNLNYAQASKSPEYFPLSVYIDPEVTEQNNEAYTVLENKLKQIVSSNGITNSSSRFVLTANSNILTKDVLGTAPSTFAYTLGINFIIGDGVEGNKFATKSVTVKGVGSNETKAIINAFKNIKFNEAEFQSFVANGKKQIINYYNNRCSSVLKEAKMLENQSQFDEALYMLTGIPESSSCYDKALASVDQMYRNKINGECKIKLADAQNYWNSNPTSDGANVVAEILSGIDPRATCFKEVSAFANKVGKRVIEIDGREWKFKVDKEIGLEKDRLKSIRDIGVAYGQGQAKNVNYIYKTSGW